MTKRESRQMATWLFGCCIFVALMVFVGGVTRLTESGLSITEWKPITGAIPPLTEAAWEDAFEKYKQIPEYKTINFGMSLEAFKNIYWWEFFHRLLGRLTGFVFFLPWLYFIHKGYPNRKLNLRLLGIFALGGLQGLMGWYMVKSGLVERTDVSQYRLATHLLLAFALFALVYWQALTLWRPRPRKKKVPDAPLPPVLYKAAVALVALLFIQVGMGALVAGLNAGFTYNTFPLMDGKWVPENLWQLKPFYKNFFENITMVQFQHRWMAKLVGAAYIAYWFWLKRFELSEPLRLAVNGMILAVLLQILLGVETLVRVVPITLASTHQMGALLLLAFTLSVAFLLRRANPA